MIEKEKIEYATAVSFIELYNKLHKSSYKVVKVTDAPDILCEDDNTGQTLKLEITLSEDRDNDIVASLGRSNARDINVVAAENGKVDCLQIGPYEKMFNGIKNKLRKDYGKNVALVVRHVSGIDWDFDLILESLRKSLDLSRPIYDKGIWILNNSCNRIYKL